MSYAPDFMELGGVKHKMLGSMMLMLWNFIATLVAMALADRVDRRSLLLPSIFCMALAVLIIHPARYAIFGGVVEGRGWAHQGIGQHTNYWAPRTRKRHQQEHRPQRPTERSDPTQHAKGRTGACSGPRKGATTRRNVTRGSERRRMADGDCRISVGLSTAVVRVRMVVRSVAVVRALTVIDAVCAVLLSNCMSIGCMGEAWPVLVCVGAHMCLLSVLEPVSATVFTPLHWSGVPLLPDRQDSVATQGCRVLADAAYCSDTKGVRFVASLVFEWRRKAAPG